MSVTYSPKWNKALRQQGKTTPKYDPDRDQGRGKSRGLSVRRKPKASEVKQFGQRTEEGDVYVWRLTYGDTTYKTSRPMTQAEIDERTVRRWREATGRGTTFTGSDPGSADGDYGVTKVYENRLVHAGRMIGKRGTQVLIDELLAMDPDLFK